MNNTIKRYIIFTIGLFINSFGVSFVTKSNLGTSPISSIPFVLSNKYPFTLGQFTIAMSIVLVLIQMIILVKEFPKEWLLQLPVSILFGYFIDASMYLLSSLAPVSYLSRGISLLIGCLILGIGVYIEVLANVVMLPGESFVKAITMRFNTDFGKTKIFFDTSMTIIAIILCFIFFAELNGVGIGTVIAAILVGYIARSIGKKLHFLDEMLFGKTIIE